MLGLGEYLKQRLRGGVRVAEPLDAKPPSPANMLSTHYPLDLVFTGGGPGGIAIGALISGGLGLIGGGRVPGRVFITLRRQGVSLGGYFGARHVAVVKAWGGQCAFA